MDYLRKSGESVAAVVVMASVKEIIEAKEVTGIGLFNMVLLNVVLIQYFIASSEKIKNYLVGS